jgi:hypothetical protein
MVSRESVNEVFLPDKEDCLEYLREQRSAGTSVTDANSREDHSFTCRAKSNTLHSEKAKRRIQVLKSAISRGKLRWALQALVRLSNESTVEA